MKIAKKCLFALLVVFANIFIASASEGGVFSNTNKYDVRFIKNTHRVPDQIFQSQLRETKTWQNFLKKNGTWYVIFNEENAMPHRAFGTPVYVFGMNPQAKAMNFISSALNGFKLPLSDLEYKSTSQSQHFQYVHYGQKYKGLNVLFSDLYVKMTHTGGVITFGCDVYNNINISTTPSLSSAAAISAAKKDIADIVISTSISNDLSVLPIPNNKLIEFKLVYEVTVETMDEMNIPAKYHTLVDANTGEVLYRYNKVMHFDDKKAPLPPANTDINIEATVYATHVYNPSSVKPLANLKVVQGGNTYYTDTLGYLGLTNTSSASVTLSLEGLWSKVRSNGVTPSFTTTVNPGANTISFNNPNIRERSAYYHVNIVHDYMKGKFPLFTDMDSPLNTNVDVTGTCNAIYNEHQKLFIINVVVIIHWLR